MSKPNSTLVALSLDSSSSMASLTATVRDGLVNFLNKQKTLSHPCTLYVNTFDYGVTRTIAFQPISKVASIPYSPNGHTALYDGIGLMIDDISGYISKLPTEEQPERVICAVITDGDENHSSSYSAAKIRDLVEGYERDYHWDFLFVGSNQDAYKVGSQLGIKPGKALSFAAGTDGLTLGLSAIGNTVLNYRHNGAPAANEFFTKDDHDQQAKMGAKISPYSAA